MKLVRAAAVARWCIRPVWKAASSARWPMRLPWSSMMVAMLQARRQLSLWACR